MPSRIRLEDTAFVLHKRAYKNTSLIVTLFTEQQGCIHAVAQGASRTHKSGTTKKPLDMFRYYYCYLQTSGTLYKLLDYQQKPPSLCLSPQAMMIAQYCNEAMLRALPTELAVPHMFRQYQYLLHKLHTETRITVATLTCFNALLDSVISALCHANDWHELMPDTLEAQYHYQLYDAGIAPAKTSQGALLGRHLLAARNNTDEHADYQRQQMRCRALIHINGCLRHTAAATRTHTQSAELVLAALLANGA